jgi:hypothetical protein
MINQIYGYLKNLIILYMENTKLLMDKILSLIVEKRIRENLENTRLSVSKQEYQDIENKINSVSYESFFDSVPILD